MSEKRLQKRDEISDEYKWKLEDMYCLLYTSDAADD